jgi:hypothetical protein
MADSLDPLLARLEQAKTQFAPGAGARMEKLLDTLARRRFPDAGSLVRFHEAVLFARAYPQNPGVLERAEEILAGFARYVEALRAAGADLTPFEAPEVSGIAGTSFSAGFTYAVTRSLAGRYAADIEIDWEWLPKPDRLGLVLPRLLPLFAEDWPVEANIPYREWLTAARNGQGTDLAFLLDRLGKLPACERAGLYESLELLLAWRLANSPATRTRARFPSQEIFFHDGPLLTRRDVSLAIELDAPPLPVERVPRDKAAKILELVVDNSAVRYRELYGFTHGDPNSMLRAEAGRGVEFYLWGVPPDRRLPLRAYHGGLMVKNGVPIGYAEGLSLFERMELGFNLYYTFREGESAWLYARLLRLFRHALGVTRFSVDPYQIGYENEEAIESGAFWFYRKLGFRPMRPELALLAVEEEKKIQRRPGYRTPERTLRRLAEGGMIYEPPGVAQGDWDGFEVRRVGFAALRRLERDFGGDAARLRAEVARALGEDPPDENWALALSLIPDLHCWTDAEKQAAVDVTRARRGADEAEYLRLMQGHPRLRAAILPAGMR